MENQKTKSRTGVLEQKACVETKVETEEKDLGLNNADLGSKNRGGEKQGRQRSPRTNRPSKRRRKFGRPDRPRRDNRKSRFDADFIGDDERSNAEFEAYYRDQSIVPEAEFPTLMKTLATPLPSSFRIAADSPFREGILKTLQNDMSHLFSQVREGSEMNRNENDEPLKPPKPLAWYPNGLAWTVSAPRQMLRRDNVLAPFHQFIVGMHELGAINRQEAVSMIPPLFLDVQKGHAVIDMCAAPGSKTAQLLEAVCGRRKALTDTGIVIANDADLKRCWMLSHQMKRFGSAELVVTHHEAQHFPKFMMFDRVLCDVPCSGDGTLRKAPDIWRRWNSHMGISLHRLQRQIVERGVDILKPGGRLVYSTCSMNPIENEAIVAHVLRKYGENVELLDCSEMLPDLIRRPGLHSWLVKDNSDREECANGNSSAVEGHSDKKLLGWFRTYEEVPHRRRTRIVKTLFPPSEEDYRSGQFKLERCMRLVPHDQDTGAFFIAVFHKKANAKISRRQWFEERAAKGEEEQVAKDKAGKAVEDKVEQAVEDKAEQAVDNKAKQAVDDKAKQAVDDKAEQAVDDKVDQSVADQAEQAVNDKANQSVVDKTEQAVDGMAEQVVADKVEQAFDDKAEQAFEGKAEELQAGKLQIMVGNTVKGSELLKTNGAIEQKVGVENSEFTTQTVAPESEISCKTIDVKVEVEKRSKVEIENEDHVKVEAEVVTHTKVITEVEKKIIVTAPEGIGNSKTTGESKLTKCLKKSHGMNSEMFKTDGELTLTDDKQTEMTKTDLNSALSVCENVIRNIDAEEISSSPERKNERPSKGTERQRGIDKLLTEDPLVGAVKISPNSLESIIDFFGLQRYIGEHYLMTRGRDEKPLRRVVALSRTARTVVRHAIGSEDPVVSVERRVVRVVNAGVRVLERTDRRDTLCGFRLIQDGIGIMRKTMTERIIDKDVDREQVLRLLKESTIKIVDGQTEDGTSFWKRVLSMESGSAVIVCEGEEIIIWIGKRKIDVVMAPDIVKALLMRFQV